MRLPWFRTATPTSSTGVYRRADQVMAARQGDRTVLMSVKGGQYYALDPVGSRVWELLDAPATAAEIARVMAAEYDAPEETIRADVAELLDGMTRDGLVRAG